MHLLVCYLNYKMHGATIKIQNIIMSSKNGTKENVRYGYQLKIFLSFMDSINICCPISF